MLEKCLAMRPEDQQDQFRTRREDEISPREWESQLVDNNLGVALSMSEHRKGQIGIFYTNLPSSWWLLLLVWGHTPKISRYDPSTNCFTSDALAAGNKCSESWKSLDPIGRTPTVQEIVRTWRYHSLRKISGMQTHSLLNQEGFPILPTRFIKLMVVTLQIFNGNLT